MYSCESLLRDVLKSKQSVSNLRLQANMQLLLLTIALLVLFKTCLGTVTARGPWLMPVMQSPLLVKLAFITVAAMLTTTVVTDKP